MATHRYWRVCGIAVAGLGALELTELRIYADGALADAGAVPTSTIAPTVGSMDLLQDGLATAVVAWPLADRSSPGFSINWDFGSSPVEVSHIRMGAGSSASTFPVWVTTQFSDDGLNWSNKAESYRISYPGDFTLMGAVSAGGGVVVDPDFDKVTLLLPFDTDLLDKSLTGVSVTPLNGAALSSVTGKFSSQALRLDGTQSLVLPNPVIAALAGEDFTAEAWIYPTAAPTYAQVLADSTTSPSTQILMNAGKMWFWDGVSSGTTLPLNAWTHFAVVRVAGLVKVYLGGVGGVPVAKGAAVSIRHIGSFNGSSEFFTGSITQLRITKGLARYTSNFTPPTQAFPTAGGGGGGADPFLSSVVFQSSFTGAPGSATMVDQSPKARAMTSRNGAVLSNAQSKYGGSSTYLTAGAYWSSPASSDFTFDGDFTIEFWAWKSGNGSNGYDSPCLADTSNGSAASWFTELSTNRGFLFAIGSQSISASVPFVNDASWHHYALSRVEGVARIFLDGALATTKALSGTILGAGEFGVGRNTVSSYYHFNGYIDDMRITKGVGRYTAAFTPPDSFEAPLGGPGSPYLPLDKVAPPFVTQQASPEVRYPGDSETAPQTFKLSAAVTYPFFEVNFGGQGMIYGTVKEKVNPNNRALRRKVLLVDERSAVVVAQTWSDEVTGDYEFRGVREGVPYTVLSYDHLHNYRATIADNLLPDPLP